MKKNLAKNFGIIILLLVMVPLLSACQPLYADFARDGNSQTQMLANISVAEVDTRQAQQVRNHLIFLLSGGRQAKNAGYELRLNVTTNNSQLLARSGSAGNSAGRVSLTGSYDLVEIKTGKIVASGSRFTHANYDRTSQSFANERARRNAENRAARSLAEQLRHAVAADLGSV